MNLIACRQLIERTTHQIEAANAANATTVAMDTLELVWVLHMAMAHQRSMESHERSMRMLDALIDGHEETKVQITDADIGMLTAALTTDDSFEEQALQDMHAMVAALCQQCGDNPAEVACDMWRLAEHVKRLTDKIAMQNELIELMKEEAKHAGT